MRIEEPSTAAVNSRIMSDKEGRKIQTAATGFRTKVGDSSQIEKGSDCTNPIKSRLVSSWLCRNKEQFKLSKSFVNETPECNSEKLVLSDENMNLSLLDKF